MCFIIFDGIHMHVCQLVMWLALPLARAWVYSSGTDIISATTHLPVRLRCVNWYGAHMETFVAGGLDKRSCGAIAESIRGLGANCVRIPLSTQLVLQDPSPPASAITASECNASTALQVLDCQVRELTRRGLMVILNNHNSFPGWVGANEKVPQGLWHTQSFPTTAWVASLSALAARYTSNPLVVGIDIRNEIHDQNGIAITWGRSNNTDSDWKAATLLADAAIREANPEVLVIVSGLCRAYDLRAMQDLDNYRSKYVFTTHVYIFSWWFTNVNWVAVLCLSLLFVAGNVGAVYYLKRNQCRYDQAFDYMDAPRYKQWAYVLAGSVLIPVYLVVVSLVWMHQANKAGCSSIAADAHVTLYVGMAGLVAVSCGFYVLATHENVMCWGMLGTCLCLSNAGLGVVQAGLSVFYQTYGAVMWDLRRWNSKSIPVWVGEFGAKVGDTSVAWGWLLTYVTRMHYAYWPLNGCAQRLEKMESLHVDTYGILECDWVTVRNPNWTASVFP